MNVTELIAALQAELKRRKYFVCMEVLEQTLSLIKVRLYISPDLFIQIYRNDRFNTTSLALIHNGERVFARDELDGHWHRHTHNTPEEHDISLEGSKTVKLGGFLDEVEIVLAALDLPWAAHAAEGSAIHNFQNETKKSGRPTQNLENLEQDTCLPARILKIHVWRQDALVFGHPKEWGDILLQEPSAGCSLAEG